MDIVLAILSSTGLPLPGRLHISLHFQRSHVCDFDRLDLCNLGFHHCSLVGFLGHLVFSEHHVPVDECMQGVIFAHRYVWSRMKLRAPLAHDNLPGTAELPAVQLHAESLSDGIPAVLGAAACFFGCEARWDCQWCPQRIDARPACDRRPRSGANSNGGVRCRQAANRLGSAKGGSQGSQHHTRSAKLPEQLYAAIRLAVGRVSVNPSPYRSLFRVRLLSALHQRLVVRDEDVSQRRQHTTDHDHRTQRKGQCRRWVQRHARYLSPHTSPHLDRRKGPQLDRTRELARGAG